MASKKSQRIVWTIGHSIRPIEEFISLLQDNQIQLLVDIRTYPGSRRYPHFNGDQLIKSLNQNGIDYLHLQGLGGRRKPRADSPNVAWRHSSFRGYADHMATEEFKKDFATLELQSSKRNTAFMCSEAPWWKCHRALVSDLMKVRGWKVLHIISKASPNEHPYTSPAREQQGELFYNDTTSG